MAVANETPRQKLITLMYLVFIAMLALNVSKEVLQGFGQIFIKTTVSNQKKQEENEVLYEKLNTNAEEKKGKWIKNNTTAEGIKEKSQDIYSFIENIKQEITKSQVKKDPELKKYNQMDSSEALDLIFFGKGGVTGNEFVTKISDYKNYIQKLSSSKIFQTTIENRFFTGDENNEIINIDNNKQKWISFEYEGFPLISSLAKLTQLQNDIKVSENEILLNLLGREFESESQVTKENYITFLKTAKSAYFQGEKFDGSIILGRKGGTQKPNKVNLTIDGRKLDATKYDLIPGGIQLKINAGNSGDHIIEGDLIFLNNNVESKIPVNQKFSVISRPNSALVAADKMNVVYRGVDNPMTISIPGIANNKVKVSASGLRKLQGSKYIMNPRSGRKVVITASGILPDGSRITTPVEFRIKDIPRPTGTVRGETGEITIPKSNLAISSIGAILDDFDFDIKLKTVSFKFKVPGQPTIEVKGDKLNPRAKSALRRTRAGASVQIFDIKVINPKNPNYKFKKVSPVICELIN